VPVFTAPPIALPKGAKIEAMSIGPDRIVLNIVLADGSGNSWFSICGPAA
jgi:hypothetical protein